jgi:phosphonate transport system substrate-binding protein
MNVSRAAILLAIALSALAAHSQPGVDAMPSGYRLGVFPFVAPRSIVDLYGPVSTEMSAALDVPVKLETTSSFSSFAEALAAESYDIAHIQPFDYAEAVEKHGYIPIARLSVPLVAQFFVRGDSKYRKIEDLRGTALALPPALSANARMALHVLRAANLVPGRDIEVRNFSANDSCLQQVWSGAASACVTSKTPVIVFERRMQASFRAIHDAPPIPHTLFVVHSRVPAGQRLKLQALLLGWNQSDAGRDTLKHLGYPGLAPVQPDEYSVMQKYAAFEPAAGESPPPAGRELLLGIFPYLPSRQVAEQNAALLPALAAAAGQGVQLRTTGSFGAFLDSVAAGQFDIIMVQPFDYAAAASQGYLPLARNGGAIEAHVFVRADSAYRQFADLKGARIAMPPFGSAVARLGRAGLKNAGLVPDHDVTVDYRRDHESCLQQVQRKEAAACVTSLGILATTPKDLSGGLRSVAELGKIPGLVFLAHRRVPEKLREKLRDAMLSWEGTETGRRLMRDAYLGPLAPFDPAEYANLPHLDELR